MNDTPGTAHIPDKKFPKNALVVEDDAVLALMIEDALRDAGIAEVTTCGTAQAAFDALRKQRPEALILDVHLADSHDGWAIAELVMEIGPDRPRIVFSTGAPERIPEKVAKLGVVLTKPYSPRDLIEALKPARRVGLLGRFKNGSAKKA